MRETPLFDSANCSLIPLTHRVALVIPEKVQIAEGTIGDVYRNVRIISRLVNGLII